MTPLPESRGDFVARMYAGMKLVRYNTLSTHPQQPANTQSTHPDRLHARRRKPNTPRLWLPPKLTRSSPTSATLPPARPGRLSMQDLQMDHKRTGCAQHHSIPANHANHPPLYPHHLQPRAVVPEQQGYCYQISQEETRNSGQGVPLHSQST